MAQLLDSEDVVEFKELLLANTIQIDTMYQLLIPEGIFYGSGILGKDEAGAGGLLKEWACLMG